MATNYEQIQADLAASNYTLWEPLDISEVQLNLCRIKCLEEELGLIATELVVVGDALNDIENIATSDTDTDVTFKISDITNQPYAWDLNPTTSGMIMFNINTYSPFFKNYLIPNVSELVVPTTTVDADGNTVDRPEGDVHNDRLNALRTRPIVVVETSIAAVNAYKDIVSAKRAKLEETYE